MLLFVWFVCWIFSPFRVIFISIFGKYIWIEIDIKNLFVCVCVWPKTKIYRFCKFRWILHVIFFLLSVIQSILPKGNVGFFVTFFHQISLLLLLLLIWIKNSSSCVCSCKSIRFLARKLTVDHKTFFSFLMFSLQN